MDGDFVGQLEQWIAGIVRRELQANGQGDEWIQQRGSALGNRKHCAAVRRRIASGEGGAAIQGKRFLLTTSALTEELRRGGPPPILDQLAKAKPRDGGDNDAAELDDEAYTSIMAVARGHR